MREDYAINMLTKAIIEYGIGKTTDELKIRNEIKRISIDNVTRNNLRAALMSTGKIIEENLEEGYCLAIVSPSSNKTIVMATIKDGSLDMMAYAREGLLSQKTAERAMKQVLDALL